MISAGGPQPTSLPQHSLLAKMLEANVRTFGTKTALRYRDRSTTYYALQQRALRVANGLLALGVGPGDRIVYLGRNRDRLFDLMFGAARIGAALVPINTRLADPELEWILEDAAAKAFFVGVEFADRITPERVGEGFKVVLQAEGPDAYDAWCERQWNAPVPIHDDPNAPALQIYTSGTTGRPKGAMLSQRALLALRSLPASAQPEWNRWTEDDVSLLVTPQFHIGGCGYGLQTLCAGATGVIVEEFKPDRVLDMIGTHRLSKLFVVPSMLRMLLAEPNVRSVDYSRIRAIVYGAAPITPDLLEEAMDVFACGFVHQYGMTEMAGTVTVLGPEDHDLSGNRRMRSVGRPLAGVEVVIADPDSVRLAADQVGEILIRSPTAMKGYWNREEANLKAFDAEGFYRTGDAGSLDEDGYLYIVDRLNDMIVSGGENVYPVEVENALAAHPGVNEAAVIGVPDVKWGETVKAVIVAERDTSPPTPDELTTWCRARIAGYKIPRIIEFSDALPRNGAGKVLRHVLRSSHQASQP